MIHLKKLFLLLSFLTPVFAVAQITNATLLNDLKNAKGHDQLDAVRRLAIFNIRAKPDDSFKYATRLDSLSKAYNDQYFLAESYGIRGAILKLKGEYEKAIKYHFEALRIKEKNKDELAIGVTYNDIGTIYQDTKQLKEALTFYKKSYDYIRNYDIGKDPKRLTTYKRGLSLCLNNIGNIYNDLLKRDSAYYYYKLSYANAIKFDDKPAQAIVLDNLAEIDLQKNNIDTALAQFKAAYEIDNASGDLVGIVYALRGIGKCQLKLSQCKEAIVTLEKAVAIEEKNKLKLELAKTLIELKSAYECIGDDKAVVKLQDKYIQLKDTLFNEQTANQLKELQTKFETEKKEKQIELLNRQNIIQGLNLKNQTLVLAQNKLALTNVNLENERNKLQVNNQKLDLAKRQAQLNSKQLEAEKKQQQISILNKESTIQKQVISRRNIIIGFVIGAFIICCALAYLFYNRYKLKQAAALQAEVIHQQDLATQGIIEAEERERKRIASDLHDGVGQLFSAVKWNLSSLMERVNITRTEDEDLAEKTIAMVDESCREVRTIAHQMMPNVLLKLGLTSAVKDFINKIDAEKLKVTVETAGLNERLSNNIETVLYRVIQECVNNVIKHAQANRLDIQLDRTENEISVTVEDNGKGFDTADSEKFEGIGLKNIQTRLAYLKGTVEFSSSPGKGTLVAIYVPLEG